jgi:hypothetical protein
MIKFNLFEKLFYGLSSLAAIGSVIYTCTVLVLSM